METTIWICALIMLVVFGLGFWMLSRDIRALHSTVDHDLDRIEKKLEEIHLRMLK